MKLRRLIMVIGALTATVGLAVGLTACNAKGTEMDAGQMTQSEVENLSLEAQFDVMGQRYATMQELLRDAQLRVADADTVWAWISAGIAPSQGNYAPTTLDGATADNSYFLDMRRAVRLPGASGARAELDPMLELFEENGWGHEIEATGDGWNARAITDEGYLMRYTVQENGQYNLALFGGPYWGDTRGLLHAVVERIPEEHRAPEESLPGTFTPFPNWGDPALGSDSHARS